jgi:hypothetical protein
MKPAAHLRKLLDRHERKPDLAEHGPENGSTANRNSFTSQNPFLKKEIARGGERTRVLLISFIFSFFATLPLSHSGSP